MWLVKGAPNLMQRLSRLPPVPNVTLLDRRKPKSLSWPHANTTFTQQTYIRWCCIDLSNAPRLPGVETDFIKVCYNFSSPIIPYAEKKQCRFQRSRSRYPLTSFR